MENVGIWSLFDSLYRKLAHRTKKYASLDFLLVHRKWPQMITFSVHKPHILASIFILFVGILDAVFKFFALRSFPPETDPNLSRIFAFALHKNPGITFDIELPLSVILLATCVIITIILIHLPNTLSTQPLVGVGFISILTGALNNMIDRIVNGFTTDYLMFFHTSVLNLSDLLILLGAGITLMYYKNNPRTQRP